MTNEWDPSSWGRKLTWSPEWRLRLDGLELSLTMDGRFHQFNIEDTTTYRIHPGILWMDITF
jgi:DNA helicase-4